MLMVAVMTDLLELKPDDVVLEVGTGPWLPGRSPRRADKQGIQRRNDRATGPTGGAAAETTGQQQRRSPGRERLFRLACLPEARQLVVAEKDLRGRFAMKEIMPVLFSLLEGADEPAYRVS
jgi:hypothetical protein